MRAGTSSHDTKARAKPHSPPAGKAQPMNAWIPTSTLASRLRTRLRPERGVVMVEFAIVLPVLLLIILGILYFGRYEDYSNQETQLAETGVRAAAVDYTPSSGTLQNYIQTQAQPELQAGSSDVTSPAAVWIYLPSSSTGYTAGQPIRTCVVATVKFPTPLGVPTTTIAQAATMRIEQVQSGFTATGSNPTPFTAGNPSGTMPSACPS